LLSDEQKAKFNTMGPPPKATSSPQVVAAAIPFLLIAIIVNHVSVAAAWTAKDQNPRRSTPLTALTGGNPGPIDRVSTLRLSGFLMTRLAWWVGGSLLITITHECLQQRGQQLVTRTQLKINRDWRLQSREDIACQCIIVGNRRLWP
jgi:hypothetical protein